MQRYTVLKVWAYASFTAPPVAAIISAEMPGTLVKLPTVMPENKAGSDDAGRPAESAAGVTLLGMFLAASVERMDEYMLVAIAARPVRMAPITPVTRPISAGSQRYAVEESVRFSMYPAAMVPISRQAVVELREFGVAAAIAATKPVVKTAATVI